jgi:hypothetical protein
MRRLPLLVLLAAVLALSGAMLASGASRSSSGRFAGKTSQGKKLSLKFAKKGVKFSIPWSANCHDGGQAFTGTTANSRSLRMRRKGSFSYRGSFVDKAADGQPVRYAVTVKGKLRGKRARGSWSLAVAGPYAEGGNYSCSTGTVKWSAKRR